MLIRKHFRNFFSFSIQSIEAGKEPLETAQFMLTSLYICPNVDSTSQEKKTFNIIFSSVIAATQFCGLATSLSFIIKFILTDFEGSLFAFLAFIGHVILIYSFLTAFYLRNKIGDIFKQLKIIHGNSKKKAFSWISQENFHEICVSKQIFAVYTQHIVCWKLLLRIPWKSSLK